MPWLFERYATGEWTAGMLVEELRKCDVTSLPHPNRPSTPLSLSNVYSILRNRYYTGVVTFEGVEYSGRHPALISEQL